MTPAELYKRKPESTTRDLGLLIGCYYSFIPEIDEGDFQWHGDLKENTRIEVVVYKDFDFDGRRFWRLAAVKFDNDFVMIIQNAGREGDDHTARFITNGDAYRNMVAYIHTLLPIFTEDLNDVVPVDDNINGLTNFYGNDLDGFFERY